MVRASLFAAIVAASIALWIFHPTWLPVIQKMIQPQHSSETVSATVRKPEPESTIVKITPQACANLGLSCGPIRIQDYWRKIETMGVISDRPGFTDLGITASIDCFVSKIHAYEGDIVRPGEKLFTLRLTSQYLQQTQSDYFKALRETEILNEEIGRISGLADRGIVPEKRIIQLKQDLKRQQVEIQAHRQDLISRGLGEEQLLQIANGNFIKTIDVVVPEKLDDMPSNYQSNLDSPKPQLLELQELKIELGERAMAGQILAVLADHNHLYINGHGFKNEAANIARAAEAGWKIEVEFVDHDGGNWPELDFPLKIRHLSNSVDRDSRTFDFFVPLSNQSRIYEQAGKTFVIWRFRPGQRVKLKVPVEKIENVFAIPAEGVVMEGPEAYVFQQNGEFYNRISVHVLYRDRDFVLVADDGGIKNGFYIANNSAAALNRILKAQSASGDNMAGFHVHADGSVHANH